MSIRSSQNIDDFIFSMINHSKLRDWHRDNSIRIKTLSDKIIKLRKEHFVHEGEKDKEVVKMQPGKQVLVAPAEMNGDEIIKDAVYQDGPLEPVCIEGKTREEFDKKHNALLDEMNIMQY
jgi:hypothetical protein